MGVVFIPENVYEKDIELVEAGLRFSDQESEDIFAWEDIKHIFNFDRYNVLAIITRQDKDAIGNLFTIKGMRYDQVVNHVWQRWLSAIPERTAIRDFDYPPAVRTSDQKTISRDSYYWLISFLFFTVALAGIFLSEERQTLQAKDAWWLILGGLFGLVSLFFFVNYRKRLRRRNLARISFDNDALVISYDDESRAAVDIATIRKHNFHKAPINAKIKFSDGTKLHHLERLSYWPVFRQKLLGALEQAKVQK